MEIQNDKKFILGVEKLIKPMAVSNLLFFQRFKGLLPPSIMKRLLFRAAKNTPYIGFVIEPYSLFLFFKLKDLAYAKSMLPERYELAKTQIFADEEPDYYMGIGNLNTRASTFWGMRQEFYLMATDKETGLLSFIFIDILSNTLIANPSRGVANPNCEKAVFTTSSKGEVFLHFIESKTKRQLSLSGSLKRGTMRSLYQPLWLMGNTSIAFSKQHNAGDENPFAVIFDPAEVMEALDIPLADIHMGENTLFPGLAEEEPSKVVCFPFAQHYIADSPGCRTIVKDRNDLIRKYNGLGDPGRMNTFSAMTIIKQVAAVIAVIVIIAIALSLIF
jgi:hypothetical protein